jgi:hypothetical protein
VAAAPSLRREERKMKILATAAALAAACIAALPAAAARPTPLPVVGLQPTQLPVPAGVIAAHPGGSAGVISAVVARAPTDGVSTDEAERIGCWRGYFSGDNSGLWGEERETINPYWCGNGNVTRGVDSGWHYQSCSWLVTCGGESGVGTWIGCSSGCGSIGQQIVGHFRVQIVSSFGVDITVAYELYGNGGYWSYAWHN